jgi:hypothetical protein
VSGRVREIPLRRLNVIRTGFGSDAVVVSGRKSPPAQIPGAVPTGRPA